MSEKYATGGITNGEGVRGNPGPDISFGSVHKNANGYRDSKTLTDAEKETMSRALNDLQAEIKRLR